MIISKHPSLFVQTNRLILVPFTLDIFEQIAENDFSFLANHHLKRTEYWPDEEFYEYVPRAIQNLRKVEYPTGFESWMIIKKETNEIIGDLGFKGFNFLSHSCDLGYAIIEPERRKGYAMEACLGLIDWVKNIDSTIAITAATQHDNFGSMELLKKMNFFEINRDDELIYWEMKPSEV